jgi:hypothetical protein
LNPLALESQILEYIRDRIDGINYNVEDLVVASYMYLADYVPNRRVQTLARFVLNALRQGSVKVKESNQYKTLSSMQVNVAGISNVLLVTPPKFTESIRRTPIHCLGDLLFIGSHTADFIYGRVENLDDRVGRAKAYKSEYFITVRTNNAKWVPDPHQEELLSKYPEGLDTLGVYWYRTKFIEA